MTTPASTPLTFLGSVTKTQLWSRKAMTELWEQRAKLLSEKEVARLDKLFKAKKTSGLYQSQVITYKTSSKSEVGRKGYGRLYGYNGFSLEQLNADLRATLCKDIYHDLDIVNCQPTLLRHLAEQYGKPLPWLSLYVERRDKFLEELQADMECSRADAKEAVIAVLYGGASHHPLLRTLSTEIREFATFLATTDEWSPIFNLTPADNRLGSFLSCVLQNEERRCLLAMNDYMTTEGWEVDVLAYDGFMVRRREGHPITPDLLEALGAVVRNATGYDIRLAEKDMVGIVVPAPEPSMVEIAPGVTAAAYAAMKARFEENHFYLAGACKVCAYDADTNKLHQLSKDQAVESLTHWFFPSSSGKFTDNTLFVPLWMKDPARRLVKEIRMGPVTDDPTVFTMPFKPEWASNDVSAVDTEAVEAFTEFLGHLMPEAELRGLFIEWLAHLLQKPFENSKTCIVLAGGKGCGKDTLGDFIGQFLLGEAYYQNYPQAPQFWDKHDMGRFGKLFVKVEEAMGTLNRYHEAEFKGIITSTTLTVNPKGVSPLTMPNYVRYFLTTNEASPVKLDDQERRFVIIPCGNSLIGNTDYWRNLYAKLFNPTAAYSVASWLMEQTIGAFPRVLPKSELHKEIIETERTTEERFAIESGPWSKEEMTATELFQEYRGWCLENGHTPTANTRWFGRNMGQVAMDGKVKRRMLHGVSLYRKLETVTPLGGAGVE